MKTYCSIRNLNQVQVYEILESERIPPNAAEASIKCLNFWQLTHHSPKKYMSTFLLWIRHYWRKCRSLSFCSVWLNSFSLQMQTCCRKCTKFFIWIDTVGHKDITIRLLFFDQLSDHIVGVAFEKKHAVYCGLNVEQCGRITEMTASGGSRKAVLEIIWTA